MSDEEKSYPSLDEFGDRLALAARSHPDRRMRRWRRRALLPLLAVGVLAAGGVATAQLTKDDEPVRPGLLFTDPVLGRNCGQAHALHAQVTPGEEKGTYSAATITCADGADPGLSESELSKAEALAIDKAEAAVLPLAAYDSDPLNDQIVIDADAQIPIINPETGKRIRYPDGSPLTQSHRESIAPLEERMKRGPIEGELPESALPECPDGATPREYLRMLGADRKPG